MENEFYAQKAVKKNLLVLFFSTCVTNSKVYFFIKKADMTVCFSCFLAVRDKKSGTLSSASFGAELIF